MKTENKTALTATEMEHAIVTILLSQQNTLPEVATWLTPDMFGTRACGFIYRAILNQFERGEQADFLTTENEMRKMDETYTAEINGLAVLMDSLTTVRHAGNLKRYAGEVKQLWLKRLLATLCIHIQQQCYLPETDTLTVIQQLESELLNIRQGVQDTPDMEQVPGMAKEILELHIRRIEGLEEPAIYTGLHEFDALFGGFHNGELYVEGGRPGDGKTALGLDIAMRVALAGKKVCYFSPEMTKLQTMNRLFAGYGGIRPGNLRVSNLTQEEIEQMSGLTGQWKDLPLYFDFSPINSAQDIRAKVLLMNQVEKCNLVVVDYVQMMEEDLRRNETMDQFIGRNIKQLKALAKEAGCPVLVMSQMNRNSENRAADYHKPMLSDLRDSGVIEQVADGVFFVYNPSRYGLVEDPEGRSLKDCTIVIVRKNRNGTTGEAYLRRNDSHTRFYNY